MRRSCVTGQNQNGDSLRHEDHAAKVCTTGNHATQNCAQTTHQCNQTDDKTEPNCAPANGTLASIAALHRLEYDLFKCPSTLWFDPKPFGDTKLPQGSSPSPSSSFRPKHPQIDRQIILFVLVCCFMSVMFVGSLPDFSS